MVAQARANRFKLEHAIEDVDNQIANLRASVATLKSRKATLELARANLKRGEELLAERGASARRSSTSAARSVKVDGGGRRTSPRRRSTRSRVGLGLPAQPPKGHDLSDVPADLDQNFSAVRQALGALAPERGPVRLLPGLVDRDAQSRPSTTSTSKTPRGTSIASSPGSFPRRPPSSRPRPSSSRPSRDLDQAELNLRYCDIVSEIDGVVTSRNVNPGNNVQAGQSLMAVRSLTEIWIDANFKETQLADLRIGQRVRCEVDMYGSRREFEGRITGFTMGTGQTLALLPPQNATGNFVKIVQRLPVRIELTDYDPDKAPLFVGLSVVPYVYYKEPPTGPHAGDVLQPLARCRKAPRSPTPEAPFANGGTPCPWPRLDG